MIDTGLTGRFITTAQVEYDGQTGRPVVGMVFNDEGGNLFAKITKENIGRQLAIVLDDVVISAPTITVRSWEEKLQITGSYTVQEA